MDLPDELKIILPSPEDTCNCNRRYCDCNNHCLGGYIYRRTREIQQLTRRDNNNNNNNDGWGLRRALQIRDRIMNFFRR